MSREYAISLAIILLISYCAPKQEVRETTASSAVHGGDVYFLQEIEKLEADTVMVRKMKLLDMLRSHGSRLKTLVATFKKCPIKNIGLGTSMNEYPATSFRHGLIIKHAKNISSRQISEFEFSFMTIAVRDIDKDGYS
jgi:hypothetical protein